MDDCLGARWLPLQLFTIPFVLCMPGVLYTCPLMLCFQMRRNQIRKGMVMLATSETPVACWEFEGDILVLHHPTTISTKYQAMGQQRRHTLWHFVSFSLPKPILSTFSHKSFTHHE